ncbi:1,4-dihydroxy-2-naphthoate octaprenyltransferase [Cyclobacterium xiamenense]|uniref:1,4-dihydroxy-2-naphthoate octaprenyltransferase n=1 Tax=Cyclobacterium xiamenense TaxID=1297121 RepID=A0A1H6W0Q3_9BACT|nr:UbiA family prenyltransferase [Cyclobacterium xiamenense]SEJ10483.1 1,4-dihydroxy-2-naphthoate octaprenyltransferase [Cyclobacterium xiamenense]
MFKKSSWEHLRIPFSYYLMPVYWFALATLTEIELFRAVMVWVVLHLFLYPSSNGYNSYFDKDEKSIGGLKNPKKVSLDLYYLSLVFFLIALGLALVLGTAFFWMVLVYGLVSMAYSHPSIRLKKYPYVSWLTAGFFQGAFTFWMCVEGLGDSEWSWPLPDSLWMPASLTSILLLGSYPLTQIYQHEEDSKRGDETLSLKLGLSGTFGFSSIWLLLGGIAFAGYFFYTNQPWAVWVFLLAMLPVVCYFSVWFFLAQKDPERYVSHSMSMWMNKISATALNVFFVYLVWQSQAAIP